MGLLQTPSGYPGLSRRVLNIQHLHRGFGVFPVGLHLRGAPRNLLRYPSHGSAHATPLGAGFVACCLLKEEFLHQSGSRQPASPSPSGCVISSGTRTPRGAVLQERGAGHQRTGLFPPAR